MRPTRARASTASSASPSRSVRTTTRRGERSPPACLPVCGNMRPVRLRRGEGRLLLLLLVAYGWLFVFFQRINNPNELVRVYAARALAEEHTWTIGRREAAFGRFFDDGPVYRDWGYVNDKALTCDDPALRPPACAGW